MTLLVVMVKCVKLKTVEPVKVVTHNKIDQRPRQQKDSFFVIASVNTKLIIGH